MNRLGIIVPCYNEEEVFDDTNLKLTKLIKSLIKKKKLLVIVLFYMLMMGVKIVLGIK